MSEWKEYKLGEISQVKGGKRLPKGATLSSIPNKHPYIRVRDMGSKYFSVSNLEYVSDEVFPSIKKYIVDKHNVVLSIVGSVGLVSIVNEELDKASLTENCVKILPNNSILNNEFLYYFLTSSIGQNEIKKKIVGAVQSKLPIYNINDISLSLPPLPTQTAIAEILSSLDDKIELNNAINKNLEDLAQTLFRRWFVDFEFPDENGQPYKSSGGEMVESEMGTIPKGWRVSPIGRLFEYVIGGDWGKDGPDAEHTEIMHVVRGTDIPTIKLGFKTDVPVRAIRPSKAHNRKLMPGDIIIEISGGSKDQATGRSLYLTKERLELLDNSAIPASFCRLIRPCTGFNELISIYLTKLYNDGGTWEYQNQSTGISNFQFKYFEKAELIVLPGDNSILSLFNTVVKGILSKMTLNENNELVKLRDVLLPKLISGELEVKEAQTQIKNAL